MATRLRLGEVEAQDREKRIDLLCCTKKKAPFLSWIGAFAFDKLTITDTLE